MEKKFSYAEVIGHGWVMTKKHFMTILVIVFVYLAFNAADFVLNYFGGRSVIDASAVGMLYADKQERERFYEYLYDQGFIDEKGKVLDKLQALGSEEDLQLSPEMEGNRERIYILLNQHRNRLPFPRPVTLGLRIVLFVLNLVMAVGYVKMMVMLARDRKPAVKELFSNWRLVIPNVAAGICFFLMVVIGLVLLIVPGIIVLLMFQMYAYLIVDKGLGPIAALNRSRMITKGSRGRLFILGCLLNLVNLAGLLCLGIGLVVTIPLTAIVSAYVYDRLERAPDVFRKAREQGSVGTDINGQV